MKKKIKVKKSVSKRFKVTKTGKVLYDHQMHMHLRSKKSKKRLRRQKEIGQLTGAFAKKIKQMMALA